MKNERTSAYRHTALKADSWLCPTKLLKEIVELIVSSGPSVGKTVLVLSVGECRKSDAK
jgi:hypothetical protein